MEKFGIFELLDALSAITAASGKGSPSAEGQEKTDDAPADERPAKKRTPDAAFAPPTYGTEAPAQTAAGRTAYEGFLARHASATSKVKK